MNGSYPNVNCYWHKSKMFAFYFFSALAIRFIFIGDHASGMIEVFKWKELDFVNCDRMPGTQTEYPAFVYQGLASKHDLLQTHFGLSSELDEVSETAPMCSGEEPDESFITYNNMPMDVSRYKDLLLVTEPRHLEDATEYPAFFYPGLSPKHDLLQTDFDLSSELIEDTKTAPMCGGLEADEPFIPYNNIPMGVTRYKDLLFVTVPRRREGVPSTLNYINMSQSKGNKSPQLRPFPHMFANQYKSNPFGLVSVYRTALDVCERLWFVDTGSLEYPDNFQQVRAPSVWIYDLKSNKVVRRYEIPNDVVELGRGMISITVDVEADNCEAAFAYMPDMYARRLHVYSLAENLAWSFEHHSFNPDRTAGNVTVSGQSFMWNDGIFSVTLGSPLGDGSRNVYYHAMQSNYEFVVSNRFLQHKSNVLHAKYGSDFQFMGSRGLQKQSTMHKYDRRTDVMFYAEVNNNAIGCWNARTRFNRFNHDIVAQDNERMIYPSDLTIDDNGTIWVVTNSLPIFIYEGLNPNKYNFRIWKQTAVEAIRGTICE